MYYQTQLRNLQKQAELSRRLAGITVAEDRLFDRKEQSLKSSRNLARSRRQEDQETQVHLERSRIQAELQASSVSTNAILNRSRIESALQVRQRNQQLNTQRERSLMQQRYHEAALLAAEQEFYLESNRQAELQSIRQANIREDLYQRIRHEEEQRIQYDLKQAELRRQVYEEELKRQLRQKEFSYYESLRRPYPYY